MNFDQKFQGPGIFIQFLVEIIYIFFETKKHNPNVVVITNKNKFSCYCVGLNTTNSAKKLGLNSKFLGKDIKSFIKNFPQDGKNEYHYLRGEDITFDLSSSLKRMGLKIRETIVYKQLSKNLSDQAKLSLQSNEETTIIVFSNLSALAILNDLDKIKLSNTEFLCLSANIENKSKRKLSD